MHKNDFKDALAALRSNAPSRKFSQSVDLIINIKDINLKQPTQHLDFFLQLPHSEGKNKICALVGGELIEHAQSTCDHAVLNDSFGDVDKKQQKKLAREYSFFIAQANIMPDVAKHFGRVFGPLGKMPNPKAGCVVPPNANLAPLVEKLKKTIRVKVKTELAAKAKLGSEAMTDDQLADNAVAIYNQVIHNLPNEQNNVKNVLLKFTMSKPVKVGAKEAKQ